MTRRILCLWLPYWPIQRLVVESPALRDCGVILYRVEGSRGKRVVTCSRTARRAGVQAGMPLAEATALTTIAPKKISSNLDKGPSLHAAPRDSGREAGEPVVQWWDPVADQQRLREVAEWSEQFTPCVGWQTISELPWEMSDGLLMEIGGTARVLGGEAALAAQIADEVQRLGYYPRLAVAATPAAAYAAARYATTAREPICLAPPMPSSLPSPQAVPAAPWARLPIEGLRLAPETVTTLHRLGVLYWHELQALPRASLAARLGDQPVIRLGQMTGEIPEYIEPHRPPTPFLATTVLEHPTAHREVLRHVTQQLLRQLGEQLRQQGQGVIRLLCGFQSVAPPANSLANGPTKGPTNGPKKGPTNADNARRTVGGRLERVLEIDVGLFRPTVCDAHLWSLIQMQFEQSVIPVAVGKVSVEVVVAAPLRQRQGELFGDASRSPRELAHLLERLSSRLGREAVVFPKLLREPLPEDTFVEQPAAGQKLAPLRRQSSRRTGRERSQSRIDERSAVSPLPDGASPDGARLERPLFFYHPPRPLRVEWDDVYQPQRLLLSLQGRAAVWHRVAQFWGPERLETSWWRGPSIRRDYFRVQLENGQRYWIFRRLRDDFWFLHGSFG